MEKHIFQKVLLSTLLCCLLGTSALAQNFTKSFKEASLPDVIREIERQTGYSFVYEKANLSESKPITGSFKNASVQSVLSSIIKPPFKYEIKGKMVAITSDKAAAKAASSENETTVSGVVRDKKTGETLVGAVVWVKDTPIASTADGDGKYKLSFKGNYGFISVSLLGYKEQEIAIHKGPQTIDIELEQDSNVLEEAVAIGYGHQKKVSVVGAISTIEPGALKVPASKLSNALAGRLSGVISIQRSGEPGVGSTFWIRGMSTFGANATPLILVDGIERSLDIVDVEDIKEFSILKDAAATAVYGVRGANGVVLITTRNGEEGKPKVTFKVESGLVAPTKVPDMANGEQYCRMYNDAYGKEYYSQDYIDKTINGSDPDLYPNVDWVKEIFKKASSNTRANVNVSGGTSAVKYYVSGGFYNENGLFKEDPTLAYNTSIYYRKFNFRANLDINITRHTSLSMKLATSFEQKNQGGTNSGSIWACALVTPSVSFPMVYSNGSLPGPGDKQGANPYSLLTQTGYRQNFYNNAQSVVGVTHDFSWLTDGLSANVKGSFDAYNHHDQYRTKTPEQWGNATRDENGDLQLSQLVPGSQTLDYSYASYGWRALYLEASLNYARSLGKHGLTGLLLFQQSQKNYVGSSATDSQAALPYRHQGLAFRATYNYNNLYFLEFNAGYNGSENFSPGKRFGFFPSVAAGWLVSDEKFWAPVKGVVSLLKFKGSYGLVGNDQIGGGRRFIYLETINEGGSYAFGQSMQYYDSYQMGEWANANVGWEKSKKLDLGVDIEFFKKLRMQIDYFKENRSGIFLERGSIPVFVGITSKPWVNIGKMRNSGVDASATYNQRIGSVELSALGNFTFARNMIQDMDEPAWTEPYMASTGQARYQTIGYVSDGLFKDEEDIKSSPDQSYLGNVRPGDIKYVDINCDGVIDAKDRKPIGYTNVPEIVYGFGLNARWKGFDVSVFFQGVGNVNFSTNSSMLMGFTPSKPAESNVFSALEGNYWTPENTDAKYPRLTIGQNTNNSVTSDFWMVDGSYIRLKNAELGYTLPKKTTSKMKLTNLRFYLSGTNLLTFSGFKLWDPDLQTGASNYPNSMILNLGLNLAF